jgi:hypothetical protein
VKYYIDALTLINFDDNSIVQCGPDDNLFVNHLNMYAVDTEKMNKNKIKFSDLY